MVKKFEEFISEGFWKDGIKRAKSNTKRLEDKSEFDRYIETIEWVDMGHPNCLYAKYDFGTYDDFFKEEKFSLIEVLNIQKSLPEGITTMNIDELLEIKYNCYLSSSHSNLCAATHKKSDNEIYFASVKEIYFLKIKPKEDYVFNEKDEKVEVIEGIGPSKVIQTNDRNPNDKLYRIKLVKRK